MTHPITVLREELRNQQTKVKNADEYIAKAKTATSASIRDNNVNYLNIVRRNAVEKVEQLEKAIEILEQVDSVNQAAKAINEAFSSILGADILDGLTKTR